MTFRLECDACGEVASGQTISLRIRGFRIDICRLCLGRLYSAFPKLKNHPAFENVKERRRRGFAAMSPEKVKRIAAQGGRAAHAQGKAHEFTSEEAVEAGQAGGFASRANRRVEAAKRGEVIASRNSEIRELHRSGVSKTELGKRYKLGPERVRQILKNDS